MLLHEFNLRNVGKRLSYEIYGSDISLQAIEAAKKADYPISIIDPIPLEFRRRYVEVYEDNGSQRFRIKPEIVEKIRYFNFNLLDHLYPLEHSVDIIFIRNVLFYFDGPTKEKVVRNIINYINLGGYMFLSHTESLMNMHAPGLKKVSASVYQRVK